MLRLVNSGIFLFFHLIESARLVLNYNTTVALGLGMSKCKQANGQRTNMLTFKIMFKERAFLHNCINDLRMRFGHHISSNF